MYRIYFTVKTSTVEYPNKRAITKLKSYKRLQDCSSLLYIHVGSDFCKVIELLTCFFANTIDMVFKSKARINIPSNTCSSPNSMKLLSVAALALELPESNRWLLPYLLSCSYF